MEKLSYFIDLDNDFLLAYDKATEFFVRFVPKVNDWEFCNISFSNFRHDYAFKEIDKDQAEKITLGNLPEAIFQQYLVMLGKNLGK